VIVQVPGIRSVITPDPFTVHTVGVVEAYVIVPPAVDVAAGTGAVEPAGVFGSAGNVIVFTPAPMFTVTVCEVAAA